jgi:hypothetical protein
MWHGVFRWLRDVLSIEHHLLQRRLRPGWRVPGPQEDVPPPDPLWTVASLRPGEVCRWDLACLCGICKRDDLVSSGFVGRITDPTRPRIFFL